ncbi:TIR domain-containing protein [Kitasatospora sp. NPDC094019]|uniref:TIR domain-containing protein n=1 Tax=Kitasatospora sp. NPDC094019 TaxID=3364091 RepID=UPI00382B225D
MKLFLSWSGQRARMTAEALRSWLPDVLQHVDPWLSSQDIAVGGRATQEIATKLSEANFGIICTTPENQGSPWLNYEAGAVSNQVGGSVVPFLIGMRVAELTSPLSQFQAVLGDNEDEVLKFLADLNSTAGSPAIPRDRLDRAFRRSWPEFESRMRDIHTLHPQSGSSDAVERSEADMTEETLLIVRSLDHRLAELERSVLQAEGTSLRPTREVRRISEEKFIASSFAKLGWEVVRSSWEGARVIIVAQSTGDSSTPIYREFAERIAKSLGRDVVVRGESGTVIVRGNLP